VVDTVSATSSALSAPFRKTLEPEAAGVSVSFPSIAIPLLSRTLELARTLPVSCGKVLLTKAIAVTDLMQERKP